MAKMLRDGISIPKDETKAGRYFEMAFNGFIEMEKNGKDDKLKYRIGQMFFVGTGTERNIDDAAYYFEKSAKLGIIHAQYMLAKIYMMPEYKGYRPANR